MADKNRLCRDHYTVGWVCALPVELAAAEEMLDENHGNCVARTGGTNIYTLGRIGEHNVVIACLPEGQTGTNSAAAVAIQMQSAFTSVRFGLMVGIGGGVPSEHSDIRLGDVVVSRPENNHGGVVQYDFGKSTPSGFKRTGFLNAPPKLLQNAVSHLRAKHMRGEDRFPEYISKFDRLPTFTRAYAGPDILFDPHYNHVSGGMCEGCDKERTIKRPSRGQQGSIIHYGLIASGNQVMRDAAERDQVSSDFGGVLCFEMEAAGLMNEFPCLVIRGICDYSDSHKNKKWQPYAAGAAAAYAKELLSIIPANEIMRLSVVEETVSSETGARTFFTVPYQRDEDFIGRESVMADLDDKLQSITSAKHTRVALVGIGGIGKSQIAIEYTYRARKRDPKLSVFWVYASNTARYEQAYRDLADELKLLGRTDPGTDIFKLVSRWLSDAANGSWLMILDNADNDDMFFQEIGTGANQGQPKASAQTALITSIPQTTNGSAIITSRNSTAARNLLTNHQDIIYIDVMEEKDALDLLQTRVTLDQGSLEDAQRLVQTLECIPLAVIQAGSYIQERSPRITVSAYLTLLQESDANLTTTLGNMNLRDSRRDYSSQHVVTATWQISFDQIRSSQPTSADLLALMSMLDWQGIPETLLRQDMSQFEFENAVHPLVSFSLIKETKTQRSFQLHRLVQISVREWLESNGQLQLWIKRSAELVAAAFPSGKFETWTECQNLIPHAKEIMRQDVVNSGPSRAIQSSKLGLRQRLMRKLIHQKMEELPENNKEILAWAITGSKAGWYLFRRGKYEEAKSMHRLALRDFEKLLGSEHPGTLTSINNLGLVLSHQGKYEEAESMHRRALRDYEKVLGPEHHYTTTNINNFGLVLHKQGKYEEAESMYRRVLRNCEKVLGPEHPDTLASINNLGLVLCHQGKYEEAESMHRRVLRDDEKVLGPEHPGTLTSINNLGLVLDNQGKYEEAESMHRRALGTMRKC
ncbi:hypothetical protein BDV11DRAFT_170455 [Aspergillus similis]